MNDKIRARRTLTLLCGITTGLFTACAWATWIVITRSGVHTTLTSYDITALRFLVSGIIMLPFAVRRSSPFTRIGMIRSLILSAGTGIPYVLLSIGGLAFAPATHAAIIVPGGVPLFNAVFSRWFERNRPSLLYRCGLYLILAGILMIGWDLWSIHAQSYLKGDLLFLCASECYTWYTIAARSWNIAPLDAAVVVNVISFIFYLPVYIFIIGSHFENAPIGDIALQAVYQGIITSIIVVMALTYTVKILGSTVAAAFIALVPVLAALLAMSLLGEIPSILQWIGIIATSTGMLGIVFGTIPAISLRRRESTVEKSISHTFGESGSLE